jgi:O-6-methylguanine DNA methyltransferase
MVKIISFSKGPRIRVTLHRGRASLSLANRFECEILGVADESLLAFLTNYAERNPGHVELPLGNLSTFRQKVLTSLQKVAFGSTLTYGELALEAGHPGAARAVGTACHYNPFPLFIPCHRVIASGGKMGGFACDLEIKKLLLEFEEG